MRLRPLLILLSLVVIAGAAILLATQGRSHRPTVKPATGANKSKVPAAPLERMVGQQLMVRMAGTSPDSRLLRRIRRGEVGGVILFRDNVVSPRQVAGLVTRLQAAARAGGNPRLLISTDQEGGEVKRLPWAPPAVSAPDLGAQAPTDAQAQGQATGAALRAVGINVDLAPVVDVAHSDDAFIWRQRRSFGMSAARVTDSTSAFARGMESAGVAPTAKHFPGLGAAHTDTDYALQRLTVQDDDLSPYEQLIAERIPLIMVSTAVYSNLDGSSPADLSKDVISDLLRRGLGYDGVVMTDDLERPTGSSTADAAVRADRAGADIILVSTTEDGGRRAYHAMLSAARSRRIPSAAVADAYRRILALKRQYAGAKT